MLKDLPIIVKHVRQMEQGNLGSNMNINRNDEIGEIAQSIEQMEELLNIQVQEMDFQARYDSLTSLPNRTSVRRQLAKWIEDMRNTPQMIAVTFLDLDHFKQINDLKGHSYGNDLLIQVAERIQQLLPKHSYFGRFGGDEFIILLHREREHFPFIRTTLNKIIYMMHFQKHFT